MSCLDCFKKIKYSCFYNFHHPLNEIVIMNNKNIHTQQPVYEKNTFLYNKYNKIQEYESLKQPYNVHNNVKIPEIIINDTDEEIIYDKFREKLNNILLNKIKTIKKNELEYKKQRVEKLLEKNKNNLRNRKNKIDVIENVEWDVIE